LGSFWQDAYGGRCSCGIANTRKIAAVVLGGKFLAREDLDLMLSKARAAANGAGDL
jgi:hypothetical protein